MLAGGHGASFSFLIDIKARADLPAYISVYRKSLHSLPIGDTELPNILRTKRQEIIMKKIAMLLAVASAVTAAPYVAAQESPWLVRVRAVNISPENKSDPVGGSGVSDRKST